MRRSHLLTSCCFIFTSLTTTKAIAEPGLPRITLEPLFSYFINPPNRISQLGDNRGDLPCLVGETYVRRAQRSIRNFDLDALVSLDQASFREPLSEAMFVKSLSYNQNAQWLAVVDNKIVGSMIINIIGAAKFVVLQQIAVHPEFRKKGIGTDMLTAVQLAYLNKGPRETLITTVDPDNISALKFFINNGFQFLGPVKLNGKIAHAFAHKFMGTYFSDRKAILRRAEERRASASQPSRAQDLTGFRQYLADVKEFYNKVWQLSLNQAPGQFYPPYMDELQAWVRELTDKFPIDKTLFGQRGELLLKETWLDESNAHQMLGLISGFEDRFMQPRRGIDD